MQEENARACTQSGGRFIDTLITQWVNRTGSNVPSQQAEEQVAESSNTKDVDNNKQQALQNHERVIQSLKRKLKESQEAEASLSASLETEVRNREEIQTKLNATWVYIENITEYFNYIKESLASFQQHRTSLASLYDNVILKQQETIQKLQLNDSKSKDLENHVAQLKNNSLFQEERLQEAIAEQNKLRKQLETSECELQLQRNELANAHAAEKLTLVKEQQRLLLEYENVQSRLQMVEKEKCDIVAQLENKLLLHEDKMQEALMEHNKLKKQAESAEREFHSQKNELTRAYAEEKKMLIEKQQRLQLESENLQSRLNTLEQDKNNITEIIEQKDALISKLEDEVSMYKNQIDTITARYNETSAKCEALTERQHTREEELVTKTERIQNLETMLSAVKQREADLVNDVNRIEETLTNKRDYINNLENKLSNVQRDLQLAQMQNTAMKENLERTKSTNEFTTTELQQKLKALQREKEEIIKRESTKNKNAETLYENTRTKHTEEISTLKNNYETRLVELQKTIEYLNEVINGIKKENNALNKSLTETRADNTNLRNNHEFLMRRNDDLQKKLKEAAEITQIKSIDDRKPTSVSTKYDDSTPVSLNDNNEDKPTQTLDSMRPSMKKHNQNEQEAEVTSVTSKKFFKFRSVQPQPRTYAKRRRD
ncbi:CAP-Gly domain-containing linker protein 1-like isoform X1 [Temnothorax curvispinosus]|uniref:CAP-Gly domain-containing linker protein 1-like isoform X1 n=1 Tax=Temnothorax curvispinosus TaxID=300111 RepID=A0A6J1RDQ1_9HYME|nr:CAP-Gly domain-containing linker protein 1-like isoform X1 [Temnothorax curvispinosus]